VNKETIVTQAILLAILASVITFLVVSYETPEEKAEVNVKELENEIKFLEVELATNSLKYELLSQITDYYIAYGLDGKNIDDTEWECVKWKGILTFVNLKYPQISDKTQEMVEYTCENKEIKFPVDNSQEILQSEILDKEFVLRVAQNLEKDKLTISGTIPKSHYSVSGAVYAGDIEEIRIIHAFSIVSDGDGRYKLVIDTPTYDPKWQEVEYTISVTFDQEHKQLRFTR